MSSRQMHYLYVNLFMAAAGLLILNACGSNSQSAQVHVSILPNSPIVFNSPMTYSTLSGATTNVVGPWMKFQALINNQSNSPVTIEAITLQVSDNLNPSNPPTLVTFSPTEDNYTSQTDTCTFSDYGEFDPGGSSKTPTSSTASNSFNNIPLFEVPATGSTSGCVVNLPSFIVGSLPVTSTTQTSFSYTVMLIPQGWFGTRTSQTGRLTTQFYFTTQ